ncbi:GrpB family protein [Catenulispora sp. NF23]|uniref:GrpB family protein n=1 Tax=Catenulispora pinistramenti TaxID=2705254 RepID=A0ABS5KV80_9ACTN|nr:GrpB family protein [Catenulispora pinistramenti]MBS2536401.1 GrpB family protein [Catenulispora pinistramenti]MBS2549900.1 GrpB family protein [Catenulispora pinistramenti]
MAIEHVGSTAVPGCPAKPIIDVGIVLPDPSLMPELITRLGGLRYKHEGDLGITGREAFQKPSPVRHHLYGAVVDTKPYLDHVLLRDYLRTHPDEVRHYGEAKAALVKDLGADSAARDAHPEAKSALVEALLANAYSAHAAGDS